MVTSHRLGVDAIGPAHGNHLGYPQDIEDLDLCGLLLGGSGIVFGDG